MYVEDPILLFCLIKDTQMYQHVKNKNICCIVSTLPLSRLKNNRLVYVVSFNNDHSP